MNHKQLLEAHNEYLNKIDTKTTDYDDWHKRRYKGLGGSDIGTVLGLNKYKSVYQLWLEKTCRAEPTKMNNKMYFGHVLESTIADEFAKATGYKVRVSNKHYKAKYEPWLIGNIDRLITISDKEKAILECKNCSNNSSFNDGYIYREGSFYHGAKCTRDSVPLTYYCQCQHYMYITGIHKCFLACLIDGSDFRIYEIVYNLNDVQQIVSKATHFWFNNVIADTEPSKILTDFDNTTDRVQSQCLDTNNEIIAKNLIAEYIGVSAEIKKMEKHQEEIKTNLLKLVNTDVKEVCDNQSNVLFTITSQCRHNFDKDKFKKEHADLYPQYIKESYTKPSISIKGM